MVKPFFQDFVKHHNCGTCFMDGTLLLEGKPWKCTNPTTNPFWKEPIDVINKVETRSQLKHMKVAGHRYMKKYYDHIKRIKEDKRKLEELSSTDDESGNEFEYPLHDPSDDHSEHEDLCLNEPYRGELSKTQTKKINESYPLPSHCNI